MNDNYVEIYTTGARKSKVDNEGIIKVPCEYLEDLKLSIGDDVSISNIIIDGEPALLIKKKRIHFTDIAKLEKLEIQDDLFKVGENVKVIYNRAGNKECEYIGVIEEIIKSKWQMDNSISYYLILNTFLDKRLLIDRIKQIQKI